jgi:UDP-N-acetyl-D-galactosamine dehydrogenase
VVDPWVDPEEAWREYGLELVPLEDLEGPYEAAILAVDHRQFAGIGDRLRELVGGTGVIYDVKGCLPRDIVTARL